MIIATLVAVGLSCTPKISDGDTLRCGKERIRLLGIDAPELAGHCSAGRVCVAGDPLKSKLALEQTVAGKKLQIVRVGKDRYGRTLGVIYVNGRNVSCSQISGGYAIYVEKWDNGQRVRKDCPVASAGNSRPILLPSPSDRNDFSGPIE